MRDTNDYNYRPEKGKSNTGLIVAVSVLSSVLVLGIAVIALLATGVLRIGNIGLAEPEPTFAPVVTATPAPVPPPAPPATVQPRVWAYDEDDVEDFVEDSLEAFVYGINAGDSSYVNVYFSGSAAQEELNSHKSISDIVQQEIIHELDCHSVTRISPSQVTVIRDSVIEVIYNDGTAKNIPERYKYTVDLTNGMKIVALSSM